jgi:hypothetical protein
MAESGEWDGYSRLSFPGIHWQIKGSKFPSVATLGSACVQDLAAATLSVEGFRLNLLNFSNWHPSRIVLQPARLLL